MWNKAKRIVRDNVPSSEVDLSEIEELRLVERGREHSLIDIDDSESRLELNLDALGGEERQEFVGEIVETFETQHRLFSGDPNKIREATSLVLSEDEIEETVEFFSQYLSSTYIKLLERSLSIDRAWHIRKFSRDEMKDYKKDIAEDYVENAVGGDHNDAYTSIHMASSGYYNEDGYLRAVFLNLDDEYSDESVDYSRIYATILDESPFLVTVGDDDEVQDTVSDFVERIEDADTYRFDVEFIDGRAQAGWNRETLEEAVLVIQRDADTLNYDCTVKPGETIYRLFPGSLSGLTLDP
ncbi:hypothetical protein [Halorientalis halophila]|uniref:hypothetical protein n=1 Tax=Halorientalis halophila TaxID=3108499 RepID=UPI00300934F5